MRRLVGVIVLLIIAQMNIGIALAAEKKPVTLGAVYGLTGDWSPYGIPSSRGAQLFVKQINKRGGVLGRPMKLIVKDSEGSIDKAAECVWSILSEDPEVAALFGSTRLFSPHQYSFT